MTTTKIMYSSYAEPINGIRVGRAYDFGKNKSGYFYSDGDTEVAIELEDAKALFSPVDKTWDEVLKAPTTKKVVSE